MPEVVIEIVSNKVGGEDSAKLERYAAIGIPSYVIFDPMKILGDEVLRVYEFDSRTRSYQPLNSHWFPLISLGVTLWQGEFEGKDDVWLRWCDKQGRVIPTGKELAEQERRQKEVAQQQAEQERQRAERLLAQLKASGVEPEV